MKYFQFKGLLMEEGWVSPAYVGVDDSGLIHYLSEVPPANAIPIEYVKGLALPGFQNAHSHAFQFAMAGMAEIHQPGSSDDFWSWREAMYKCAMLMEPDQMEAVAAMLYVEMLRKGYTHVAEFHYLHHDKNGKPYANLAEMGERLLAAATAAGIKITLVPVFYQQGGFGLPPQARQIRFISKTIDEYFHLLDDTSQIVAQNQHARLGFGVHSLRAVDADDIVRTYEQGPKNIPFHLHAAEQLKEVEDCLSTLKQRPVEWLLNHLPLDEQFHLVHCTHLDDAEVIQLAKSKANVVLCPGTEGNLGDGIFRLKDFAKENGRWSIGTDSHISLNPVEDLRWLDYAQRLVSHKRNTFDNGASTLLNKTLRSGRLAMGNSADKYFKVGQPLDAVIYDMDSPLLTQPNQRHWLPTIIYTADSAAIKGTLVNGKWVVKNAMHVNGDEIQKEFVKHSINLHG